MDQLSVLGWIHIPRTANNASTINHWYGVWFVPYLNFHRPCAYRVTKINTKGKRIHTKLKTNPK